MLGSSMVSTRGLRPIKEIAFFPAYPSHRRHEHRIPLRAADQAEVEEVALQDEDDVFARHAGALAAEAARDERIGQALRHGGQVI